jgi:transposase InsO family protein
MDKNSLLKSIYYNPLTGFSGENQLYLRAREYGITLKDVKEFLKNQTVAQLHRPVNRKIDYFPIIGRAGGSYQTDIMFYDAFGRQNRGYKAILLFIEVTSRMLYVYPLKQKSALEVSLAFNRFLADIDYKIVTLNSDIGTEFTNSTFQGIVDKYGIKHYTSEPGNHTQQGKVERVIRTLREKIEKYFTLTGTVAFSLLLIHLRLQKQIHS